jgi:hypothetical protein
MLSLIRPYVVLLCIIFLLAACHKDAGTKPSVVVESPTILTVKVGDTVYIKGDHFSETASDNIVTVNSMPVTVVAATVTELKIVVPAGAASGTIAVTLNGTTVQAGSLTVKPFTLFALKNDLTTGSLHQLVSIDPETGSQTLIATLSDRSDFDLSDMVYLPSTNEIMGIIENGQKLYRINVDTKQSTIVTIDPKAYTDYHELVVDKYANLYAVSHWWAGAFFDQYLNRIDPKTGVVTELAKLYTGEMAYTSLVYFAGTNQVAGLTMMNGIQTFDLETKISGNITLYKNNITYTKLVGDNQSNVYAYKSDHTDPSNAIGSISKINLATGAESMVITLTEDGKINNNLAYVPARNELVAIWDTKGLCRVNINTKVVSLIPLTSVPTIHFTELATN